MSGVGPHSPALVLLQLRKFCRFLSLPVQTNSVLSTKQLYSTVNIQFKAVQSDAETFSCYRTSVGSHMRSIEW